MINFAPVTIEGGRRAVTVGCWMLEGLMVHYPTGRMASNPAGGHHPRREYRFAQAA
jgi:hypothetical protein